MFSEHLIHFTLHSRFKLNRLFCFAFCFLLFGCSLAPKELKTAEKLLETSPDSALHILQRISPKQLSDENRAWYGLLLFQTLDKLDKPLQPDSLMKFSNDYYSAHNDNLLLATCYYYNAKMVKKAQRFDEATLLYLKAIDILQNKKENYILLGKIYSDMGDICIIQHDYNEALNKFKLSIDYFTQAKDVVEANYRVISTGKVFHFQKNYRKAHRYYIQALSQTTDSMLNGFAFQEIGINYYWARNYDSAEYFLKKSLRYPYKGTNYAIRCFNLADLFFNKEYSDSAIYYANLALKYPTTYFNQRDCYRILTNVEYSLGDYKQMGFYMTKYQVCTDSVRKIEIQTKSSVLEKLHNSDQQTTGIKKNMIWIVSILIIILLGLIWLAYHFYQRIQSKRIQIKTYKQELLQKQEFVAQNLTQKFVETRELQAAARKKATPEQRIQLDKELYEKCLHLSNWEAFSCEMNHAFHQLVETLQTNYTGITQKEIIWCCLHLLDVPSADRLVILNASADSMYKLKQRLAQKMNLKSTKELDAHLKQLSSPQL